MKNLIRCAAVLLAPVLSLLPGRPAGALEFTSSFDNIKVQVQAGEVVNREFQLRLAEDQPAVHFRSRVEDWWQDETGRQSFYRPSGTLAHSCGPWVSLNPVETSVRPGGTLTVKVTVSVPAGARPAGYWCVLTVDEIPDPLTPGPKGIAISFKSSISVGIFVDLAPVDRRVEISSIELAGGRALVKLRNAGEAPAGVEGRMEFLLPGGRTPVATVLLPRVTVLPEPVPTRLMSAALPAERKLPAGRYLVRVILDAGLEHLIGVQKEMEIRHETAGPVR
jgi:hypothetical protein